MNTTSSSLWIAGFLMVGMLGCSRGDAPRLDAQGSPGSPYLATSQPEGTVDVGEARASAVDERPVVVVGRIGGSEKPFVDGLAAFTIVDRKVPHCGAEESCPTPWDYCCQQPAVKDNIATVKVVDGEGKLVPQDARQLLGVKELSLVVVRGTARCDAQGNLALLADEVYVSE